MQQFKARIQTHVEHIKNVGMQCATEETTKQALILPFLDILGFSPFNPNQVRAEYTAALPGIKEGERVDYALLADGHPVMFIEAKPYTANLTNHVSQLTRYFNSTPGVTIAALTNGREWRFYTDLKNPNLMDGEPFLAVDFLELNENEAEELYQFCADQFRPDILRTFAEDKTYLAQFQSVIESSLRTVDAEFVRYVAGRANLPRQLNAKFLESITPLVKQAVTDALGKMVVTGLNATPLAVEEAQTAAPPADQIDPDNSKIVTTETERRMLQIARDILGGVVDETEITAKDTESYYAILYQGKTNRWLLRYDGDRAKPLVHFPYTLTEKDAEVLAVRGMERGPGNSIVIQKPECLTRISGFLFDALAYCRNDENFRKGAGKEKTE